jgi:transcriptional regulator with XRE-family HTH domain
MAYIAYVFKGRRVVLTSLAKKLEEKGIDGGSLSNLAKVFSGRHDPSYTLLQAIAEIEGITLDELHELIQSCRKQYAEHKENPKPYFFK